MTTYDGHNGTLTVEGDELVLTREGLVAKASFGRGCPPRRIPLQAVHEVRYKPASRLANGWVQVLVNGVDRPELSATTAVGDPNSIMFTHGKRAAFEQLHGWLQHVVDTNREQGLDPADYPVEAAESKLEKSSSKLSELKADLANKRDGIVAAAGEAAATRAAAHEARGVLFQGTSHDAGRNAQVTLYRDRLERVKDAKLMSLSAAKQDVEVTPVRAVSSVQAKKDGMLWTKVTVYASGNDIEFRFSHAEAAAFREALMGLVLNPPSAAPAPAATAAQPDVLAQLKQLGELHSAGVLTDDEFEAKKSDLLSRL